MTDLTLVGSVGAVLFTGVVSSWSVIFLKIFQKKKKINLFHKETQGNQPVTRPRARYTSTGALALERVLATFARAEALILATSTVVEAVTNSNSIDTSRISGTGENAETGDQRNERTEVRDGRGERVRDRLSSNVDEQWIVRVQVRRARCRLA